MIERNLARLPLVLGMVLAVAGASYACAETAAAPDAGESPAADEESDAPHEDSGVSESGKTDGGSRGATNDAGTKDAGTKDAGTTDAGAKDAATNDGGAKDAAANDGGPSDAGAPCTTCGTLVAADATHDVLSNMPWHIALDDTSVYIACNYGSKVIARAPKAGGTLTGYTLGQIGSVYALAALGDDLYFVWDRASTISVRRIPKAGGGGPTELFSAGFASYVDFDNLLSDGQVIWFASGKNAGGGPRNVRRIDPATGTVTDVYSGGKYLAANATHLFWMSSSQIVTAPKDGSAQPTPIALMGTIPTHIAVEGDAVFTGRRSTIEITKVLVAAPHTETTLNTAVALGNSEDATPDYVDASHVYVVARADQAPGIYRIPRNGGSAELFAPDAYPTALAGDATHVYWTNSAREIRRKPK